jgi:pyruvate,water dikinase
MPEGKFVVWFNEVGKGDISSVGGKGANLGELTQAHIPVPPGFIVTAQAYFHFLERQGLTEYIHQLLDPLDPADSKELKKTAELIKGKISQASMPIEIEQEIRKAYNQLRGAVAVRSSATAEDLPEASFAGQQRTFLNIQGGDEVIKAVQGCWASLFEPRAIFYRAHHGFEHLKIGIAVPVQKMVQSEVSGVMFTVEPVTNDDNKILIEAVFGLGEAIVSGEITPDLYIIDKPELKITEKKIGHQEWQLIRNPLRDEGDEANVKVLLPWRERNCQKLPDEDIIHLAQLGKEIEKLYQFPQDIEWAKEGDELFILQTRPVTTLKMGEREEIPEIKAPVLLGGIEASPGVASGPVKVVYQVEQIDKVEKGDVLVAEMTTPDFVPAMKRAVAIITDRGGKTAHAAIVSRELGIPCVVGTGNATQILKDGQIVTVDGSRGKIYDGNVVPERIEVPTVVRRARIRTATKVYVNLAEPDLAEEVAAKDVDGVGLLRAEFMIAQIGEHPNYMLAQGRGSKFSERLAEGIAIFTKAFYPRPVVYRTTDFKTNEYRNLLGGDKFELREENPMLGYRGCSRYVRELEAFQLEIEAIKKVREKYNNLWVMIPFVRTVKEMAVSKELLETNGLRQSADFKLWMMVEVPSNIFLLDKFIDVGIDGISIGSNDLTQLILGIDRDNPRLAELFDERDEAVLLALEHAIKTCKARGITSSICGQAPSFYPELTQKLVEWGITSVSVSPDAIEKTREIVIQVEARLSTPSRLRRLVRSWELVEET